MQKRVEFLTCAYDSHHICVEVSPGFQMEPTELFAKLKGKKGNRISQRLFPAIPLCMVHLLEVALEVTGDDVLASYFWIGRPDAT